MNTLGFKAILVAMLVTSLTRVLTAAETTIEGGFGFKLGDTLDLAKATLMEPLRDGEGTDEKLAVYRLAPQKPVKPFQSYYVQVTPKTHQIYTILAVAHEPNPEEFKESLDVVVTALSDKYPSYTYGRGKENGHFLYFVQVGQRSIGLVNGVGKLGQHNGRPVFTLRYLDDALQELAYSEREEIAKVEKEAEQRKLDAKAKALDKSGL